jgi:hypothetical protein
MAIEDDDDRALFLDPDDFGVAVTWTRSGTPSTFDAIFSRPATLVDGAGEVAMIDRTALLYCRESDLPAGAAEDDPVAVAGQAVTFLCAAVRPTGDGMAFVDLKRA